MKPYSGLMEQKMDPYNVSEEIKKLRKKRGYSLNTFSELSGISKGYLSKIENGVNVPTITTIHKIATALKVDVTHFFLKQGEDKKNKSMVAVRKYERKEINIKINFEPIREISYELSQIDTFVPKLYLSVLHFFDSMLENEELHEIHRELQMYKDNFKRVHSSRKLFF